MTKTRAARDLLAYWYRLSAGRQAPRRDEIEPRDIKRHLPEMFILELERPGVFTFRLAGTAICESYGFELRGEDFSTLWQHDGRTGVMDLLARVVGNAEPVLLEVASESFRERMVRFELLLLPLAAPNGRLTRVLGCFAPLEEPFWLGTDPIVRQWTETIEVLDAEDGDSVPLTDRVELDVESDDLFADRSDTPAPPAIAFREVRPYLRLVKTDTR
ncbi:PAS domain-containing protein [Pyruvatibacter mobilis]|uniref:PAS domain-containing protein n=1 Tax=Pyruvatibacter mobilis TaxID=1712261 RepID=UPI003BA89CCC